MLHEDLYEISKLLLAQEDAERAPEVLLRRIVELCGAETGFVVVREDGSYRQKFEVGERGRKSDQERRFSRTLVREAIATGQLLYLREAGLHRTYLQKLLARHRQALGSLVEAREES